MAIRLQVVLLMLLLVLLVCLPAASRSPTERLEVSGRLSASAGRKTGQIVPDAKRQRQIRAALVAHGYPPGKTWTETQSIMRGIARENHWLGSRIAGLAELWKLEQSKGQ